VLVAAGRGLRLILEMILKRNGSVSPESLKRTRQAKGMNQGETLKWPDDYLIPGIKPFHQEEAGT